MANRWLITGASGLLGGHVLHALLHAASETEIMAWTGRQSLELPSQSRSRVVDLMVSDEIAAAIRAFRPTHVIHAAAMTAVGDAYARPDDADRINRAATAVIATETQACGGRLIYTSTDMVFDGDHAPYSENAEPLPVSHYGRTKLAGESAALSVRDSVVARIPLLYGMPATPRACTFAAQIASLRSGAPLRLFVDEFRTPIWVADAAQALIALATSDVTGRIHVSGPGRLSRLELIEQAARVLKIDSPRLEPISRLSISGSEPRPADLSLNGDRFLAAFPQLAPRRMGAHVFEPVGSRLS